MFLASAHDRDCDAGTQAAIGSALRGRASSCGGISPSAEARVAGRTPRDIAADEGDGCREEDPPERVRKPAPSWLVRLRSSRFFPERHWPSFQRCRRESSGGWWTCCSAWRTIRISSGTTTQSMSLVAGFSICRQVIWLSAIGRMIHPVNFGSLISKCYSFVMREIRAICGQGLEMARLADLAGLTGEIDLAGGLTRSRSKPDQVGDAAPPAASRQFHRESTPMDANSEDEGEKKSPDQS